MVSLNRLQLKCSGLKREQIKLFRLIELINRLADIKWSVIPSNKIELKQTFFFRTIIFVSFWCYLNFDASSFC